MQARVTGERCSRSGGRPDKDPPYILFAALALRAFAVKNESPPQIRRCIKQQNNIGGLVMDHLLFVTLQQNVAEHLLSSLRQAGWRITVTADVVRAKQLLQQGGISAVIMEFNPAQHDPDRLKVLRYVHEFCPGTLVIMLHSGADSLAGLAGNKVLHTLNTMDDVRTEAAPRISLDLYNLSPAQKRIAELVAQAYPNREIARKLRIKEQSVRNERSEERR